MIYVPERLWKANISLVCIVGIDIDLSNLYRDVEGNITKHDSSEKHARVLSHILCGPVACPQEEMYQNDLLWPSS